MGHDPRPPLARHQEAGRPSTEPVSIPKFTRNPEAAWALARFLNEERAEQIMGVSKRKAPTLKSAVTDPSGFLKPLRPTSRWPATCTPTPRPCPSWPARRR